MHSLPKGELVPGFRGLTFPAFCHPLPSQTLGCGCEDATGFLSTLAFLCPGLDLRVHLLSLTPGRLVPFLVVPLTLPLASSSPVFLHPSLVTSSSGLPGGNCPGRAPTHPDHGGDREGRGGFGERSPEPRCWLLAPLLLCACWTLCSQITGLSRTCGPLHVNNEDWVWVEDNPDHLEGVRFLGCLDNPRFPMTPENGFGQVPSLA